MAKYRIGSAVKFLRSFFVLGLLFCSLILSAYFISKDKFDAIDVARTTYLRKVSLLERLESLPEKELQIKDQLENLNASVAERLLYEGDFRSAQAFVQRDVRDIAGRVGLQIDSMRALGAGRYSADDLIVATSIQVNFVAPYAETIEFLGNLETFEPMLRARRLSMRLQKPSSKNQNALIAVNAEIAGFIKPNGSGQ